MKKGPINSQAMSPGLYQSVITIKSLKKGEKHFRSWLIYSVKEDSIFCCCLQFDTSGSTSRFRNDYKNRRKLNCILQDFDSEKCHIHCYIQWQELARRLEVNETIDNALQLMWNKENLIVRRKMDVISFLNSRNIAFRWSDESLGSDNNGKFLGLIELLGNYDHL